MKKFFIRIFSIVLGFVGFSSAFDYYGTSNTITTFYISSDNYYSSGFNYFNIYCGSDYELGWCYESLLNTDILLYSDSGCPFSLYDSNYSLYGGGLGFVFNVGDNPSFWLKPTEESCGGSIYLISLPSLGGGSSPEDITVYYNNGNSSTDITCDGTQAIEINGLSTITSTNTFTPYFNISYKDEDNQSLVESYSKDILYLEDGLFKKTYTGNNDWILTVQGNGHNNIFTGYLPTFEITGGINEVDSGNIFNNFAENSVKFAFSNIPSYIQYVLMFAILILILGLVKPFKKRR